MAIVLIKEDGSQVANANTYVEVSDVDTYATNHGYLEIWTGDDDLKAAAILRGMNFIESYNFKGIKADRDQALKWPREQVYDEDDYLLEDDSIPNALINACCEAAYREMESPGSLQSDVAPNVKRRKVAYDVETEYFPGGSSGVVYTAIDSFLAGLIESSYVIPVVRG